MEWMFKYYESSFLCSFGSAKAAWGGGGGGGGGGEKLGDVYIMQKGEKCGLVVRIQYVYSMYNVLQWLPFIRVYKYIYLFPFYIRINNF